MQDIGSRDPWEMTVSPRVIDDRTEPLISGNERRTELDPLTQGKHHLVAWQPQI